MKNKKRYIKPEVKKNAPLVNITFGSPPTGTSIPGTGGPAGTAYGT